MDLRAGLTKSEAEARLRERYAHEPLVSVVEGELPPLVSHARERHGCQLGGVHAHVDDRRVVVLVLVLTLFHQLHVEG